MNISRNVWNKKLLIYAVIYLAILVLFIWGIVEMFDFSQVMSRGNQNLDIDFKTSGTIIKNNIKNLLGYIALFPIFPFVFLIDFFSMSISVAMSFYAQGFAKTMVLLIPHAIIEIPNFILYTYISGMAFKRFWRNSLKGTVKYWESIREYRKWYAMCGLAIIIAGIIEGVVTPVIYERCL